MIIFAHEEGINISIGREDLPEIEDLFQEAFNGPHFESLADEEISGQLRKERGAIREIKSWVLANLIVPRHIR